MGTYLRKYWVISVGIILSVYAGLPFLAPVFMHMGWREQARVIYSIYSFLCHQLPERSFFFYGPKLTYTLSEVQAAWKPSYDPSVLRQFMGDTQLGWKMGWSDRMVAMFTSMWLFGWLWWPLRKRLKILPGWGLILFLIPMAVDGSSHLLSDLAGIGQGFRDTNLWLVRLTGNIFPASFYSGDAWGSFNSLIRLLTGIMFGLGVVWYTYPRLDAALSPNNQASMLKNEPAPVRPARNIHR
jgi:uncharacterized membrane protein